MHKQSELGNTLALVLVCIGIVVVLVAFFALNYSQLLGTNKEAKTAVDAAALQAAIDMSRIVVTSANDQTFFGNVAIVDDVYTDNSGNPDYSKRPVLGINTILATIRLDAPIANQVGNTTMLVAAMEDLNKAESDSKTLRKKILSAAQGGLATDKNGNPVTLLADVDQIYDTNSVRLASGARVGDATITSGTLQASAATNVPTPTPSGLAQVTGSFYQPNVAVDTKVLSQDLQFMFTSIADQVSLVDGSNGNFIAADANDTTAYLVPSCVQVTIQQQANAIAAVPSSKSGTSQSSTANNQSASVRPSSTLTVVATAQCGGPIRQFPSGSLVLYFGAVPPAGSGVDFSSLENLMNNSQIAVVANPSTDPAADLGTASPYKGWNGVSAGSWSEASGGAFPASAQAVLLGPSPPATAPGGNYRGRASDDPSVVLAFSVYDWLRHAYLRADIQAFANGLAAPLNLAASTGLNTGPNAGPNAGPLAGPNDQFLQPVYASGQTLHPVTFGFADVPIDGTGDPRDARAYSAHPDGTRRMVANVFGYVPAAQTLPDTMLTTTMVNGQTLTTNGQPADILFDLKNAMLSTNQYASSTFKAAQTVFKQTLKQVVAEQALINQLSGNNGGTSQNTSSGGSSSQVLTPSQQSQMDGLVQARSASIAQLKRAKNAMANASYMLNSALALLNDRKTITSMGVTKVSSNHFQIANGSFYPPTRAASVNDILTNGPVSDGQDPAAGNTDWCSPLKNKKSQLNLFVASTTSSTNTSMYSNGSWSQPALAGVASPPNLMFQFSILGDSASGGGTMQQSSLAASPYKANVQGEQSMYQNTASWISGYTEVNTSRIGVCQIWNCVARDNGASDSGGYYNDQTDAGYNGLSQGYPLIAEWTLRCPVPCAPQFCKVNDQVQVLRVSENFYGAQAEAQFGIVGHLSDVIPQTDSAGNVTFQFQGQEMHFITDANTYNRAMDSAQSEWLGQRDGYGDLGWGLTQNTASARIAAEMRSALGASGQVLSDSQMMNSFNSTQQAASMAPAINSYMSTWEQRGWTAADFKAIGDFANGVTTQTEYTDVMQGLVYNAWVFYTQSSTGCAQLYAWSS